MRDREEFITDCLFGMPGIPKIPGVMKRSPDGKFIRPSVEQVYQIYRRGYTAATTDFRRTLDDVMAAVAKAADLNEAETKAIMILFEATLEKMRGD